MHTRRLAVLAGLTAVGVLATGCRDDSAADSVGSSSPSEARSPAPDASEELDSDLGKTLTMGESSRVTYQPDPKRSFHLEITPKSVRKGAQADLDEVSLTAKERSMQPYYVTVDFTNIDERTAEDPLFYSPVRVRDGRGEDAQKVLSLEGNVKQCTIPLLEDLPARQTATACQVFLLPKGESPSVIHYRANPAKDPVFWTIDD